MTTSENSFDIVLDQKDLDVTVSDDQLSYTITKEEPVTIPAGQSYTVNQTQSWTFTDEERTEQKAQRSYVPFQSGRCLRSQHGSLAGLMSIPSSKTETMQQPPTSAQL